MRFTRRALIKSAFAAAIVAPLVSAASSFGRSRKTLPGGLWRSRSTGDLVLFGEESRRRYTCYDRFLALAEETERADIEAEVLAVRPDGPDRFELEYWGDVTRIPYDRVSGWPALPRLDSDRGWLTAPGVTVDAFFEVLAEPFAFAHERGSDWTALRAECDAALARGSVSPDHLFETLSTILLRFKDGHGSLKGQERYASSLPDPSRLYQAWQAAGGRPSYEDGSDDFRDDWLDHVQRHLLAGTGRTTARDNVVWGRLPSGFGYMALMACENLSEEEGGHADVAAASALFDHVLAGLAGVRGMIVDLRFNDGGWDRVGLTLTERFADRSRSVFTKQAVRSGIGLPLQTIAVTPTTGPRYTGPVAVLTSDATVSAAEVTALALRALPNSRSFGRPTYGALSDPFTYRLPNGWKGSISNEIYRAADGQVFEGVGIPPDQLSAEPSPEAFWETVDAPLRDAETWLLAL